MSPWTRASSALLLTTCLWWVSACTVWQYDIESCDPNQGLAACTHVNIANGVDISKSCAIVYQCNKSTLLCEQAIKDIDQDGDVPPECGGTDCNDNDARYSGIAQSCGCNLAGQPCKAGKGACVVDLTSECRGGTLACPEQLAPQYRDMAWHKEPFTAGAFSSWDWNCNQSGDTNENTEKNCAFDTSGSAIACTPTMCPDDIRMRVEDSTNYAKDAASVCALACSKNPVFTDQCRSVFNDSPDFELNCINKCGSPIFRCRCIVQCPNFNCNKCGVAMASFGIVSCR